jgi:hypothetical protein
VYFSPVLVYCTEKNLATLATNVFLTVVQCHDIALFMLANMSAPKWPQKVILTFLLLQTSLCLKDVNIKNPVYLNDGDTFLHAQNENGTFSVSPAGLPDFSRHNAPKWRKMYQITTKLPKMYQMAVIYSKRA